MLGSKNLVDSTENKKRFRNEEDNQEEHQNRAGQAQSENLHKTIKQTQIQNTNVMANVITNANAQHFFGRLFLPLNTHALPSFCVESLQRISVEYKIDNEIHVMKQLKAIASEPNASRNLLLTLFFLLFNIDTKMKTIVLQSESKSTQNKICQFSLLLRQEITPKFFVDEQEQLYKFVEKCEEAYLLA